MHGQTEDIKLTGLCLTVIKIIINALNPACRKNSHQREIIYNLQREIDKDRGQQVEEFQETEKKQTLEQNIRKHNRDQ